VPEPSSSGTPSTRKPSSQKPGWIKTILVVLCCAATFAIPIQQEPLGLHPATYALAFVLPLISLLANPIGRQWFRAPRWWQDPLLSKNRLSAAQFAAVFFAAVSATLWLQARFKGAPVPDLVWLGIAFGGGYALAVPLALPVAKSKNDRHNRNRRSGGNP
jgi:hypothetical protein